ncbi:MAG: AtpZ/AtpI family protein [Firmicutes bacterium]|nr:AtpZ/AtpI family protein [Bacillota bacterium]MBQ6259650.1 AtpZ/AtpI family protein [Bacillota bacterium]MBR0114185.1 AtpZ/AtpI family protein [Bacillota bacterium]MBR0441977.1 AtpZ/AtpI family protein [Bacillota bacterium]
MEPSNKNAKYIRDVMKGLVWVGQLGFSLAVPPIALALLAHWIMGRFGLGNWLMILFVIIGILTSGATARSFFDDQKKKDAKEASENPRPRGYSDHR